MDQLIQLSKQSQADFQKSADEFNQLKNVCDAQQTILLEISDSYPQEEDQQKELEYLEAQIAQIDEQLSDTQNLITEALQEEKESENEAGEILKTLINKFTSQLITIAANAANDGQMMILIPSLMDLEREISQTIDTLKQNGLFPETQDQAVERITKLKEHTSKVLNFMKQFSNSNQNQE